MVEFTVRRQTKTTQYFIEDLGNEMGLDMVLVPGGSFQMGSPKKEPERRESESPQHSVTVPAFFMGRYPVTQEQWRVVASFPPVNRDLKPDPSYFKGKRHPVEQVSWQDAVEFCDRLSRYTKRTYRLPTEAEWEYACRAGTTTPFSFGETITADLANYHANVSYGRGSKGEYRKTTTPIDHFKVANAFGLCDMHGNVWEWCLDGWHENYEGAPTDGSAWLREGSDFRVRRGGSWGIYPGVCRSAYRLGSYAEYADFYIGFRVVCVVPRILQ